MLDVAVPQKELEVIPKPSERPSDWIAYQDRVAFVITDYRGNLRIRTGHIVSTAGTSHTNIDNVTRTVVWCDQRLNDLADNADDAHEVVFNTKDPRLVRLDEVEVFHYTTRSIAWFEGIYSHDAARRISMLFESSDFGRKNELEEEALAFNLGLEAARKKLGHYAENGAFCPPCHE